MERNVFEAMKTIKQECLEIHTEWDGKCPKDPSVCPLYCGCCFFEDNKPKNWSIMGRKLGETEWHSEV